MARPSGARSPHITARNGSGKMPRSIQCTHCGVVLNLPAQAEGRRLKCPKCGTKFVAGDAAPGPGSTAPDATGQNADSTLVLTKQYGSLDLPVMPTAAGDLRDTFDQSMMRDAAPSSKAKAEGAARDGQTADAAILFKDEPVAPRRKKGAEARSQARRCPTCGGVVPVGMSICQTCGLDLETGLRVGLDDDYTPPTPMRSQGMPIPIAVIGGISFAGSLALAVVAFVKWHGGMEGAIYFVPVALFATFAAVQFLRGKSTKLLLAALTLGAVIDLVALVALPIYNAQADTVVEKINSTGEDPDSPGEGLRPMAERLDTDRMTMGLTLLFLYASVSIYLLSPHVHKHFRK
jgi:hypothetical protein